MPFIASTVHVWLCSSRRLSKRTVGASGCVETRSFCWVLLNTYFVVLEYFILVLLELLLTRYCVTGIL